MKILFTGGGTGGHIFPIIAVSREIRRIASDKHDIKFFYLGPKDGFAEILLSQEGIKVRTVLAGKIRRYFTLQAILKNIIDIFIKMPIGFCQAFFHIFFLAPDLVFSKGGYGSFSSGICSWLLASPIFLHESDIAPGLANRILSRFCSKLFVAFPKTEYFPFRKMIVTGNPVRRELMAGSESEAKKLFRLKADKPIILVLGGSQGAQRINDLILGILPELLENFELIHQVGEKSFKDINMEVQALIGPELQSRYRPFSFLREESLRQAYAASQLIVGRGGSGTIFEIAALAKPSILIPLPEAAQNHQAKNAYSYGASGGAVVMEEANLSPHFFIEKLKHLFSSPEILRNMRKAAGAFARPEAAGEIAKEIVDFLR